MALVVKEMQETRIQYLDQEDHPEEEIATHLENATGRGVWWAIVRSVLCIKKIYKSLLKEIAPQIWATN